MVFLNINETMKIDVNERVNSVIWSSIGIIFLCRGKFDDSKKEGFI
jgi:hypothetical protein